MYLKISLSDYFSVFNSRTKGWLWTRAPSRCSSAPSSSPPRRPLAPCAAVRERDEGHRVVARGVLLAVRHVLGRNPDAAKVATYAALQSAGWVESVDVIDEEALKRSRAELDNVAVA